MLAFKNTENTDKVARKKKSQLNLVNNQAWYVEILQQAFNTHINDKGVLCFDITVMYLHYGLPLAFFSFVI